MKALVLTYDKYRPITDHMHARYEKLWPNNSFIFQIPYQNLKSNTAQNINNIHTPPDIKSTIFNLLKDLDDDEWVYWCIDDKYPISFNLDRINQINEWVTTLSDTEISGILFCRCRSLLRPEYLTGKTITDNKGLVFLERKGYEQIWIHQYLRVKVIRHMFSKFPDVIPYAKAMDGFKDIITKPTKHRLYVSQSNYAVFGESTKRGKLTQNCYESMKQNKSTLPNWSSSRPSSNIMGEL